MCVVDCPFVVLLNIPFFPIALGVRFISSFTLDMNPCAGRLECRRHVSVDTTCHTCFGKLLSTTSPLYVMYALNPCGSFVTFGGVGTFWKKQLLYVPTPVDAPMSSGSPET